MFDKILIANRGEIALRVLRACKELGIATVAVHSTADADAMHVRLADESVCIGPPPARESYLNIPALLTACEITSAEAVHPGYGFLSENARFAEILEEHGVHFIGPRAEHIRLMGDKIEAKRTAKRLGIPVVPGSETGVSSDQEALSIARSIGFPLLVKAAAGGGGRGMKVAYSADELSHALATARAEAKAAFDDDAVYLEKYLERPRHIEIQVLGDGQGRAIHLGERDCSLQRRHQKVWEERPSPGRIVHYHPPGGLGVRIDSAVYHGYTIPPYSASLLGKLIVHGKTRGECLMRLKRALDEFVIDGIETTIPLFQTLVREQDIIDGDYHIHWLEEFLARADDGRQTTDDRRRTTE